MGGVPISDKLGRTLAVGCLRSIRTAPLHRLLHLQEDVSQLAVGIEQGCLVGGKPFVDLPEQDRFLLGNRFGVIPPLPGNDTGDSNQDEGSAGERAARFGSRRSRCLGACGLGSGEGSLVRGRLQRTLGPNGRFLAGTLFRETVTSEDKLRMELTAIAQRMAAAFALVSAKVFGSRREGGPSKILQTLHW